MPRECPEWCANGRLRRTRTAYSRHRHELAHRPPGSTRNRIGFPHPVQGRPDYSDSRVPPLEAIAEFTDSTVKPPSPAGNDTTERAFLAANDLIKESPLPRGPSLQLGRNYLYDKWTLPFLMFDELDRTLFCSKLTCNVSLTWANVPRGIPGRTFPPGLKCPRITIELSEKVLLNASKICILTALLHQMIHAYFLQCCGYRTEETRSTGYNLGHGPDFLALKAVISRKLPGTFLGPKSSRLYSEEGPSSCGRAKGYKSYAEPKPGSSKCYGSDHPLSRKEKEILRLWIKHALSTCKGTKTIECGTRPSKTYEDPVIVHIMLAVKLIYLLRSDTKKYFIIQKGESEASAAPSAFYKLKLEDYIELHFEKRIFPLERKYTSDLPELTKSPFFTNKRELHFPSTFSWSEFRSLYSFLVYKEFDPRLSSIHSESSSKDYKPGLPVILTKKDGSEQYLSTSIAAAQLGSTLSFKPLTTHAIHRLNNLGWTTNNPVKALAQIYHDSSSPNSDLRAWVKTWLALKTPSVPDAIYAKSFPTNLAVLKNHAKFKNEFALLREKEKDKKKELNSDIEAVEKQLTEAAAKAAIEAAVKDGAVKEAAEKEKKAKGGADKTGPCSTHAHGESWDAPYRWQHDPSYHGMGPPANRYQGWPNRIPPDGDTAGKCSCSHCQGYPQGRSWHS